MHKNVIEPRATFDDIDECKAAGLPEPELYGVSRQMATNELHNIVNEFNLLINKGYGAGSYFELVNY